MCVFLLKLLPNISGRERQDRCYCELTDKETEIQTGNYDDKQKAGLVKVGASENSNPASPGTSCL